MLLSNKSVSPLSIGFRSSVNMHRVVVIITYLSAVVLHRARAQTIDVSSSSSSSVAQNYIELDECKVNAIKTLGSVSCDALESSKEQLGKFAVFLLNCQRRIEDRSEFPCSESMPLKDCTFGMSETVLLYNRILMSNHDLPS